MLESRHCRITLSGMSGVGSIQAQDNYVIGNRVWQDIWRLNKRYTRWAPISGGPAQWGQASGWSDTISDFALPNGGNHQGGNDITAAGSFVVYNYSATIQTPESWTGENVNWSPGTERKSHRIDNTNFYLSYSSSTTSDMVTSASEAANDYNNTTTLHRNSTGFGVYVDEKNRGATNYAGWAKPMRGNNFCYIPIYHLPTGDRDRVNDKATRADIWLNRYYYNTQSFREYLARHEMGHVFGLYHVSCSVNSVMDTGCASQTTILQNLEKIWVNLNYPYKRNCRAPYTPNLNSPSALCKPARQALEQCPAFNHAENDLGAVDLVDKIRTYYLHARRILTPPGRYLVHVRTGASSSL